MLYLTTRKRLNDSDVPVFTIKRPDHDILLAGLTPEAYTEGQLGVNSFVYDVGGALLCSAYRAYPGIMMPEADALVSYLKEYEKTHTPNELYEEVKNVRATAIAKLLVTYPKIGK